MSRVGLNTIIAYVEVQPNISSQNSPSVAYHPWHAGFKDNIRMSWLEQNFYELRVVVVAVFLRTLSSGAKYALFLS